MCGVFDELLEGATYSMMHTGTQGTQREGTGLIHGRDHQTGEARNTGKVSLAKEQASKLAVVKQQS